MLVQNQSCCRNSDFIVKNNQVSQTFPTSKSTLKKNEEVLFVSQKALASYNAGLIKFKGTNSLPEITPALIKELTTDPRNGSKKLEQLLHSNQDNYNWRFVQYQAEFKKFTEQQLEQAHSLEELLQFRPDWKGATLRKKFAELHPGEKLEIGQPPEILGGKEGFKQITQHLVNTMNTQKDKVFSKSYEPEDLHVNGHTLKFKAIGNGKTGKVPFIVELDNGERFIIKINPDNHHSSMDRFESCDSVALSAMIDFYLTLNNCENSPKIYYYNDKYNAAVYEFVPKEDDQGKLNNAIKQYGGLRNFLTDFNSLGMTFNDTLGSDNLHYHNGKYVVIDNGHCTFSNSTKPIIRDYHQELPNNLWMSCFFN